MQKQFMKRLVGVALGVGLLLSLSVAEAQVHGLLKSYWDGWENLGGATSAGPECISTKANSIDCFTIGFGSVIYRTTWNGSTWSAPQSVTGILPSILAETTNPFTHNVLPLRMECASWGPDHIDCFVRTSDSTLWRRTWDGAYDHGWQSLGGSIGSVPDCVSTAPRRLDCFARSLNNGSLAHISFDGNVWSAWETWPADIYPGTKPECVAYLNNRIECLVVWSDQRPRHFSVRNPGRGFVDTGWGNKVTLDIGYGTSPRTPVCRTESGTDRMACFGPSTIVNPLTGNTEYTFGMWSYNPPSDNWSFVDLASDFSYTSWGTYDFDCLMLAPQRIECFELGVKKVPLSTSPGTTLLRHLTWDQFNFNFSGWINYSPATTPPSTPGTLSCVSWGSGRLDCFAGGYGYNATPLLHTWFVPFKLKVPINIPFP